MYENRITAIVKPTHRCNLACKYCFVDSCAERGEMDSKTLENMTLQLSELSGINRVNVIWHGGEPLLRGLDFYRQAVMLQGKYPNVTFDNSMQTNATLINDDVLDFCERNNITLGTSMDGPEDIHNLTRVYPDGRGSFQDVWTGVKKIKERNKDIEKRTPHGIRPAYLGGGSIVVLSKMNSKKLNEVYDFFKSHKIPIKVNPLIRSGRAIGGYRNLGIEPQEYGRALVDLFDRWFYEKESGIDVEPLSDVLGNLMTGKPVGCNFGENCRNGFVSIGPQGDIYPCGRFDGAKEYWLGNVNKNHLSDALQSRTHKVMAERSSENVVGCSSCEYSGICNAGCMHNAYVQKGNIKDKDYYCASYKILFKHLGEALDIELKNAEVKHT